jgi:hypothetical protein
MSALEMVARGYRAIQITRYAERKRRLNPLTRYTR